MSPLLTLYVVVVVVTVEGCETIGLGAAGVGFGAAGVDTLLILIF